MQALSTGQLVFMAVVVTTALAVWLTAVFLAARDPRRKSAAADAGSRDEETAATVTRPPSDDAGPSRKAAALCARSPGGCHDRLDCKAADGGSVGLGWMTSAASG